MNDGSGGERLPIVVVGIVERHDNQVLICLSSGGGSASWEFVGGAMTEERSPEAAMRRLASARAGIQVEIVQAQPPLLGQHGDREVEFRYFLCGLAGGDAKPLDYAEVRWVPAEQLREYDFRPPTDNVVHWFLDL